MSEMRPTLVPRSQAQAPTCLSRYAYGRTSETRHVLLHVPSGVYSRTVHLPQGWEPSR